jgi:hypothetical protein
MIATALAVLLTVAPAAPQTTKPATGVSKSQYFAEDTKALRSRLAEKSMAKAQPDLTHCLQSVKYYKAGVQKERPRDINVDCIVFDHGAIVLLQPGSAYKAAVKSGVYILSSDGEAHIRTDLSASIAQAPPGEPCRNCTTSNRRRTVADDATYAAATQACSLDPTSDDNGQVRAGRAGAKGATIVIDSPKRIGTLTCNCDGGPGGEGGLRGPGIIYLKPGGGGEFECPGPEGLKIRGDQGPKGESGDRCSCP